MAHRDLRGGSALPLLLAVLVLVAGAGGWNYHRNWKAEQAVPRPYRGYDDSQLAALIEAYEQEDAALEARAARVGQAGSAASAGGVLLGERIEAFDRAHRAGEARRRVQAEAGRHDGVLEALQEERALRARHGSGLAVHLRRLTSIQAGAAQSSSSELSPR